jgi:hypothetical protein
MLAAESKVRPYRTYEYDWSPELDEAGTVSDTGKFSIQTQRITAPATRPLSKTFKRAGLKEGDDDPLWEEDEILTKLRDAQKALLEAQKKHKENSDSCLRAALEQKEKAVQESDNPKSATKAAAAVELLIWKHRMFESYAKIKRVTKPGTGGGLQRVDVPKRDKNGNVIHDLDGKEGREVLLKVKDIHKVILE